MKKYTKPSVEVVELSVKESIAALRTSKSFNSNKFSITGSGSKNINTTIVTLLQSETSEL